MKMGAGEVTSARTRTRGTICETG